MERYWHQRLQELRESLGRMEELSHLQSIQRRVKEIQKSLDKSKLEKKEVSHTMQKTGTQYTQRHWMKPDQGGEAKPEQAQSKTEPEILELQPLPDISRDEIERLTRSHDPDVLKELNKLLNNRFRGELIKNEHTSKNILITTAGIGKSIYKYTGRFSTQETKKALFFLDQLLKHAKYGGEGENKHKDSNNQKKRNIEKAEHYNISYKLWGKKCDARIVLRIFPPTKKRNFTKNNLHYLVVEKIEVEPTVPGAKGNPTQLQGAEPSLQDLPLRSSYSDFPTPSSPVEKSQQIIPKSPKPKDTSVTRWSFCEAALAHAHEQGELPLCPMRCKWNPRREVQKSYKLKTSERWITIHPSGKDDPTKAILTQKLLYHFHFIIYIQTR